MAITRQGIAMGGKPYVTVTTSRNRRITFISLDAYKRHKAGALPQGYRPTLGQPRYDRQQLKATLAMLPGGKTQP